jgi:hypothetical protein
MDNPWKLAVIGTALTSMTALSTGLTTAYLMRPPAAAEAQPSTPASSAPVRYAAPTRAMRPASPTYRTAAATTPRVTPRVTPVSSEVAPASEDCATGGDRAWRIAKPGLVGSVLGAGLGAAGGAIADGGKGAGKGAIIGGLAGAALGAGYGAYKTKNECGTILGGAGDRVLGDAAFSDGGATYTNAPARAPQSAAGDRISVYSVR